MSTALQKRRSLGRHGNSHIQYLVENGSLMSKAKESPEAREEPRMGSSLAPWSCANLDLRASRDVCQQVCLQKSFALWCFTA